MSSVQTIIKQNLKTAISRSTTFQSLTDTTSADDARNFIYTTACDPSVPGCLIYLGENFVLHRPDCGIGVIASGDVIFDLYVPVPSDAETWGDVDEVVEMWCSGICDDVLEVAASEGLLLIQTVQISSVMYPGDRVLSDAGDFRVVTTTISIGLNL